MNVLLVKLELGLASGWPKKVEALCHPWSRAKLKERLTCLEGGESLGGSIIKFRQEQGIPRSRFNCWIQLLIA